MPEYSYDSDDYRFQDDRPYYNFDEREWLTPEAARDRSTEYSNRPSSKPWWIEMGVDMPDAPRTNSIQSQKRAAALQQDPFDDDMSRLQILRPDNPTPMQLTYVERDSRWPSWN